MLLISDANILFDFDCCGLLPAVFRLPHEFAVPDVLYIEELSDQHANLPALGLNIIDSPPDVIAQILGIKATYPKPGTNDLFALALARRQRCPLLTGDRRLRDAAEQEGINVRGTLWLATQMLEHQLASADRMEQAFATMRDHHRRLPWNDCKALIERHKNKK